MEIEEIGSKKDNGFKLNYSRRGEEVRRLAQSMGAERHASAEAARQQNTQVVRPTTDVADISAEASNPLSALSNSNSTRTSQILNGLEESFQGKSKDSNQHQRPGGPGAQFYR